MAEETTVTIADLKQIGSLNDLWTETIDVWNHGFMGVDIGKIIAAIAIFGAFLLIRGLFSKYILAKLHAWSSRTDTRMDDKIIDALIPPIRFIPIIIGTFMAAQYADLDDAMGEYFTKVMRSMLAFTMFWALHRSLEPMSHLVRGLEKLLTRMMVQWLFKALKVLVVFIGGAIILEIWGIQVGPLLAGLGLFGAAVALGAQDLFKNLIGGLTIIAEKRFHPGDWIKVDGVVEGTVEDIGFRSTKVRRFDKAPVHVPNAALSDAAVTNFTRMSHRRVYWMVGVEYRTSTEQLKIIRDELLEYLHNNEDFDTSDSVVTFVRVDSFGASSIDIMIYCFTKTVVWGEFLEIKEELAFKVKEVVEEKAGTGFAFPSQSVYLETWPNDGSDKPELFKPPEGKKTAKKKAA